MNNRIIGKIIKQIGKFISSGPGVAGIAFCLYALTLAPGVYGFDSAELATGVYTGGIVHPSGYPLYMLVGKLFSLLPFGDVAYCLNIMSAVFGALATWAIFEITRSLLHNRWLAAFGGMFLAVSYYFWQMTLVAEVYTLHVFLLGVNLLWLLKWRKSGEFKYLAIFAFCYGLSLTNHTSGILFAPGFAWLALKTNHWDWRRWPRLIWIVVLFSLGLLPYIYLPIRAVASPPLNYIGSHYQIDLTTWQGFWWMVSGRAYRFFAFGYPVDQAIKEVGTFAGFLTRNYLGVGLIFGAAGVFWMWKHHRDILIGLGLIFICNLIFFANYRVLDKDTMFLPSYFIWAVLIAAGLQLPRQILNRSFPSRLITRYFDYGLGSIMGIILVLGIASNWQWVDLSEMTWPSQFAREVISTTEPNATVIADWSSAVILEYYQLVEGERLDLNIINRARIRVARYYQLWEEGWPRADIMEVLGQEDLQLVQDQLAQGKVYVIEYDPLISKEFVYLPEGSFYQLSSRPSELQEERDQNKEHPHWQFLNNE